MPVATDDIDRHTSPLELAAHVWGRRKWLALLTFLPLATAVVSMVAVLPHLYESTAIVLVERQQVPEELVRSTVTSALETRLQMINQEILSRSRLEQLISRFGLYPDLRKRVSPEELIDRMRKDIHLELRGAEQKGERRATIAFALSYRGSDPQTVALVTNTLASFYIEENLKARERQATGTAEFLRVQLAETKAKLDAQEQQVSEFKKRFSGQLPQELEVNLATLQRLNAQLNLNSDSQTRVLERREFAARQMAEAGFGTLTAPEAAIDPRGARLARLRLDLAELRTRFSDKYPDVARINAEIAALEAKVPAAQSGDKTAEAPLTRQATADPQVLRMQQAVGEADAELRILRAEDKRLRDAIAVYQQRVQETPVREQQFKEITRDYDSTRELHASLLKRYAESQISESMEQRQKGEQFRVIEPALPADRPIAPKRVRLLGMGLALALGAAVGLVLLAENLDTGFYTLDDLRQFTNVPVVASIPRIVTSGDTARRRRRLRLAAAGAVLGLILVAGGSFWLARGNEQLVAFLAGRNS